jgi:hypothetical protein
MIQHLRHHAFVIEAEAEEGIKVAEAWAEKELGMKGKNNPDLVVLRYGLFSVEEARKVCDIASSAPFVSDYKVVIISASRAYHEAQNVLLKLFEEPPKETYLFLILPSLGSLLPTLRSRVQILGNDEVSGSNEKKIPEIAEEFLKSNKEKRTALIKKLASGDDEEERRENRDEAIAILNGVEAVAYVKFNKRGGEAAALLSDIAILRGYLNDRSAPVKMILEHLSLVIPNGLL